MQYFSTGQRSRQGEASFEILGSRSQKRCGQRARNHKKNRRNSEDLQHALHARMEKTAGHQRSNDAGYDSDE